MTTKALSLSDCVTTDLQTAFAEIGLRVMLRVDCAALEPNRGKHPLRETGGGVFV